MKLNIATALLVASAALVAAPEATATISAPTAVVLSQDDPKPAAKPKVVDNTKKEKRAAIKHYDLSNKKTLALGGYDPVAYFPKYGGKAKKGNKKITATHRGVTYRFSSEANKKAFLATPDAFEPGYGGWCAWAMSDGKGDKTEANPKSFTVEDGKLYVFYDGFFGDTRKKWNKKGAAPKLAANATKNWERISGEKPAAPKKDAKKKDADKAKGDPKKG